MMFKYTVFFSSSLVLLFWDVPFIPPQYFYTHFSITFFWLFNLFQDLSGPVSSVGDLVVRKAAVRCYHFLRRSLFYSFFLYVPLQASFQFLWLKKACFSCNVEESLFIHLRVHHFQVLSIDSSVFFSSKDW